jgi:hypothetical protein
LSFLYICLSDKTPESKPMNLFYLNSKRQWINFKGLQAP